MRENPYAILALMNIHQISNYKMSFNMSWTGCIYPNAKLMILSHSSMV